MRLLRWLLPIGLLAICLNAGRCDDSKDTAKAAETRKKLLSKVTVEFSDTPLEEAMEELKNQIKNLGVRYDTGVSRNVNITFKGAKVSLAEALAGMFKKNGFGYLVISKDGNAYDGNLLIKQGPERGFPAGEEPDKTVDNSKSKKAKAEKKPAADPPKEQPVDDPEATAARKVSFAKQLYDLGRKERAKERLQEVVKKYEKTKAADQARELLKKWDEE